MPSNVSGQRGLGGVKTRSTTARLQFLKNQMHAKFKMLPLLLYDSTIALISSALFLAAADVPKKNPL